MKDVRLPQQLFDRELQCGKCPREKTKKRFKDIVKSKLCALIVNINDWKQMTESWSDGKKKIYDGYKAFKIQRIKHYTLKRIHRKLDLSSVADYLQLEHTFIICCRKCLSKSALVIWDLVAANYRWLILHWSFHSNINVQVIHINSMTKYVVLQHTREAYESAWG